MISLLRRLLSPRTVLVVDVEKRFGPRLQWSTLCAILRGRKEDPLFRALGQVLACQREVCVAAVGDKSNLPAAQTAYEAGAAACTADLMAILLELERGDCHDANLQAYFGKESKGESPEVT